MWPKCECVHRHGATIAYLNIRPSRVRVGRIIWCRAQGLEAPKWNFKFFGLKQVISPTQSQTKKRIGF